MEFIDLEIIAPLTSPAVLFSALALALVFVNGLAADARAYDEFFQYHRSTMRKARSFKQGPASARYGNQVAPEMDIVR